MLVPGGSVALLVRTASLTGVSMGGAAVKMEWRLARSRLGSGGGGDDDDDDDDDDEAGEETITTAASGAIRWDWRPATLRRSERPGDSFELSFEWIGPTRERLVQTLDVPVAHSDAHISFDVPAQAELPHVPFELRVGLHRHQSIGGAPVAGAPICVFMMDADSVPSSPLAKQVDPDDIGPSGFGKTRPVSAHGDTWLSDGVPSDLAARDPSSQCELTSGADGWVRSAGCGLQLPALGKFLLCVCTLDAPGGKRHLCTAKVVGRTEAEWREHPLTEYLQRAIAPTLESKELSPGDSPAIMLHNPLASPLRALIAWGNRLGRRVQVTGPLGPGPQRVSLPAIGDECLGSCDISITLVAGTDPSRVLLVPRSLFFDARAPMRARFLLTLTVPRPSSEAVSLSIALDEPVVTPAAKTGFTLRLTDANGAPLSGAVCVIAVDKAMLSLRPHPMQTLNETFAPSLAAGSYHYTDSYTAIASARAVEAAASRIQELLALDPWIELPRWPLRPESSILELPDETVLRRHTFDITSMPWNAGIDEPVMLAEGLMEDAMPMATAEMAMPRGGDLFASVALMSRAAPMAKLAARSPLPPLPQDNVDASERSASLPATPRVRSTFVSTPLFLPSLAVGESGVLHVPWTLPDNTGAFELRAYAVTTDGRLGGGEAAAQLVRKRVTLAASLPRVARVGDRFFGGVTITASPEVRNSTRLVGQIRLRAPVAKRFGDGGREANDRSAAPPQPVIALLGANNHSLTLGPSETVELSFECQALSLGEAMLTFEVSETPQPLAAPIRDAIEVVLPVLGSAPEVVVATSRSLSASTELSFWSEGVSLPAALPGSGTISVELGTGHRPAVQAMVSALLELPRQQTASGGRPCSWTTLGAAATAAMLAPYAAGGYEHPQMGAARNALDFAAKELSAVTDAKGLRYSVESRSEHVDLSLNAWALQLLRALRHAGVSLPAALAALEGKWRNALGSGLVHVVRDSLTRGYGWHDFDTTARCRLALGSSWSPSSSAMFESGVRHALAVPTLLASADSLSASGKAALALAAMLPGSPDDDSPHWEPSPPSTEVLALLRYLASSLRVQGRTAYVAQALSSRAAASRNDNALALSAFALARRANAVAAGSADYLMSIDKLAAYVAAGSELGVWGSSAVQGLALAEYDRATGSATADARLLLLVANESNLAAGQARGTRSSAAATRPLDRAADGVIFDVELRASAPPPPPLRLPWSVLPSPPPPLVFALAGTGEVSAALGLRFVPASLLTTPTYRGIHVQRIIRSFDPIKREPKGLPLSATPLGSVVSVTIQLSTPDDLRGLEVNELVPAGLEPIDPNAAGAAADAGVGSGTWGCSWFWWRCSLFSRQTRKSSVSYYASWAHAGTHTLTFEAVAATRGNFVLPPTKASVAPQPEVMGLSAAGTFTVLPAGQPALHVEHLAAPALRCPSDCSGLGHCDTVTGRCVCKQGFTGRDCHTPLAPLILGDVGINGTLTLRSGAPFSTPVSCFRGEAGGGVGDEPAGGEGSDAGGKGGDDALPPRFALALSGDEGVLPSRGLSLHAATASLLTFQVTAPAVPEPTCVKLTLAASADGVSFSTRVVALWLLPPLHPGDADHRGACAVAEPFGGAQSYVPLPPHVPWPADDGGYASRWYMLTWLGVAAVVLSALFAFRLSTPPPCELLEKVRLKDEAVLTAEMTDAAGVDSASDSASVDSKTALFHQ